MSDYLTLDFLLTFSGAAVGVWLLTTVVNYLFGDAIAPYIKWVSFIVAEALAMLYVYVRGTGAPVEYVIGFINGIWLFATVVGINTQVTRTETQPRLAVPAAAPAPHKFLSRW